MDSLRLATPAIVPLLPCPFCGGPARTFQKYRDAKPLNWRVICDNEDPVRGELCAMAVFSDFDTEAEAIAAWNTRAPMQSGEAGNA